MSLSLKDSEGAEYCLEASCDHSASEADAVLGIVEHGILTWGNPLDGLSACSADNSNQ